MQENGESNCGKKETKAMRQNYRDWKEKRKFKQQKSIEINEQSGTKTENQLFIARFHGFFWFSAQAASFDVLRFNEAGL